MIGHLLDVALKRVQIDDQRRRLQIGGISLEKELPIHGGPA